MGYQVYVQKFEHGDSAFFPFDHLKKVLSPFGDFIEGSFGLEFSFNVGEVCDHASISGNEDTGISGITFDRPTNHMKLPEIIFDLLGIEHTCFFGPDLDFVQSRSEMSGHYPASLIENLPSGPEVITTATGSWPLK